MASRRRAHVPVIRSTPTRRGGLYERNVLGRGDYAPTGETPGHVRLPGHQAPGPGQNVPPREELFDSRNRYHAQGYTEPPRTDESLESPTTEATGDWYLRYAYKLAREGDDRLLLPYQPTPTIDPHGNEALRPDGYKYARTRAAGYDKKTQQLRVRFRKGEGWIYYDVPPAVWNEFRKAPSPGRFINAVLNRYPYGPGDF